MSLSIVSSFNGVTDPDAGAYIAAVEQADGNQLLEFGVGKAINDFVVGCKQDRIWDAIKASCILSGARTLAGALVPLVGTAPQSFNFVDANYNRKTGLVGDGSTKYLNANRADNADPQDNAHISVYVSAADTRFATTTPMIYIGSTDPSATSRRAIGPYQNDLYFTNRTGAAASGAGNLTLFMGNSRSTSSGYAIRRGQTNASRTVSSVAPGSRTILVFADNGPSSWTNARLAFYSIGESLDLALLDARVTSLINAFAVAIP